MIQVFDFFSFQLIPLAQFENMFANVLHLLRMPSYVLGNYDVMFSAVDSYSRAAVLSLFCCTYLLHNYSSHRILHESLLKNSGNKFSSKMQVGIQSQLF